MSKIVGYARVSTQGQNLDRQLIALRQYVQEDMIVTDKASGKDFDRAGYQSLKIGIGKLQKGDTLYIKSLDRLGRNKEETKQELEYFRKIGVRVKVIDIPTTMMEIEGSQNAEWILDMINNILIEVLASIAENERLTIRQRQREGIDAKRESGKWDDYGRPNIEKPSNWDSVIAEWKAGQITAVKAMEKLNMKKTSFYKLVKMETAN